MNPISQTGSRWFYADASAHRLVSDLSGLIGQQKGHKIIVAGDFNILYGYGEYRSSYWGKRYNTVFDRIDALGLRFVGPQAPEGGRQAEPWPEELPEGSLNVPTFHSNSQTPATASRQLDFVFASDSIADRVMVKALNGIKEWGPSDHCRIMINVVV
jgi:endonuclease/exonuclease/phosphatase family metal-dependent hydrolase